MERLINAVNYPAGLRDSSPQSDPTQRRLSYFDGHPNADGHAILAEALLDGLREIPAECWSAGPGGLPAALAAHRANRDSS